MTDIEIAKNAKIKPIFEIAKLLDIDEKFLELYGKYKAKISNNIIKSLENNENGKLILVTSINPTAAGEGKTTVSIGIADGLRKINKNASVVLREPSLGPVFGRKGGATGGGHSQIIPMEDINLHFTGDFHAITSANNLLASLIDNHIYQGNELNIKTVTWKRCMDLNDRSLRDGFQITAASEVMAILCLANNLVDLKEMLGNIIIGYNDENKPVYAKDINAQGAMTVLLKDAIKPNLVQTLEGTPAFVHGGPFANIAHGCNSIIAEKMALKLSDYVITEAGFGADLGAEKFIDIKSRKTGVLPCLSVCVVTIKALKNNGIDNGYKNLMKHIDNLKNKFNVNTIVAINKNENDKIEEINELENLLKNNDVEYSIIESWKLGGEGAIDIANKIVELTKTPSKVNFIYNIEDSISEKIEKICKNIYGAKSVIYTEEAKKQIENIEEIGFDKLPVCIAKTQFSFSDDSNMVNMDEEFDIHIKNVSISAGAGFIVVYTGKILTMPGLSKEPAAYHIDIDNDGNIIGIN